MKVLYHSQKGGKPLVIGMNNAKRMARRMDKRDQLSVLENIGPGNPRQHQHHTRLVQQRHAAIRDRENAYADQLQPGGTRAAAPAAGDHVGTISEPTAGANVSKLD